MSGARLWPQDLTGLPRMRRLETWFRAFFGAWGLLSCVVVFLSSRGPLQVSGAATAVTLVLTLGGVALVVGRPAPALGVASLAAATAAGIWLSPDARVGIGAEWLLNVLFFGVVMVYALPRVLLLVTGFSIGYVALRWLQSGSEWVPVAVDDAVLFGAVSVAGSALLGALVRNVRQADLAHATRVRAELATSMDRAVAQEGEAVRQLLHDEAIAALRGVVDCRPGDEPAVREECRRAAEAVERAGSDVATGDGTVAGLVELAASESPLRVEVPDRVRAHRIPVDPAHEEAVLRALRESLRNARRHAHVDRVEVSWEQDGGAAVLRIVDRGVGFSHPTPGWGVANSLEQPMRSVGGAARISSRRGAGTTVELSWPTGVPDRGASGASARVHRDTLDAIGDDGRLLLAVAVPVLLAHTYMGFRYSLGDDTAGAELALAATVFVGTLLVVGRLRRQALRTAEALAVSVLAAAAIAAGLRLAGPHAVMTYDSWIIGQISVVLTFVAFVSTPARLALTAIPSVVVVGLVLGQPGVEVSRALGSMTAVTMPPLLGYAMGRSMREAGREVTEESERLAALTAQVQRRRVKARVTAKELAHARVAVAPWLRRIAVGAVPLGDPETAATARLLGHEVRDELHLPGLLDPSLRRRITAARATGTDVVLQPPSGPRLRAEVSLRLLDRVLDHAEGAVRVVLRFPTAESPRTRLDVVPGLTPTQVVAVLPGVAGSPHQVSRNAFSTTISVEDIEDSLDAAPARVAYNEA